jgi:NAD(P)-dependent dehydrogenase (short-subunit alcohol dehydrogenase family)
MERVAIVTGGGSGIGRAVSVALASAGWRVVVVGRREAALRAVAAENAAMISAEPADVTGEQAVRDVFQRVSRRFGRLDLLFNNAGLLGPAAPVQDVALEDWHAVMSVNVTGAFLCAREAFRQMSAQQPQGGRIINNGSLSAHVPRPQTVAYSVSKHAITGLTRSLSLEGRAFNIACGQIDIGNAATELTADLGRGSLQADGRTAAEPMMDVAAVAASVVHMANLPLDANVQFMTVMATAMPFIGRG